MREEFLLEFAGAPMLFIQQPLFSKFALLADHAQAKDYQHQRRNDDGHQKQDDAAAMIALGHNGNLKIQGRRLLYSPSDGFMSGNCHGNANNLAGSYSVSSSLASRLAPSREEAL